MLEASDFDVVNNASPFVDALVNSVCTLLWNAEVTSAMTKYINMLNFEQRRHLKSEWTAESVQTSPSRKWNFILAHSKKGRAYHFGGTRHLPWCLNSGTYLTTCARQFCKLVDCTVSTLGYGRHHTNFWNDFTPAALGGEEQRWMGLFQCRMKKMPNMWKKLLNNETELNNLMAAMKKLALYILECLLGLVQNFWYMHWKLWCLRCNGMPQGAAKWTKMQKNQRDY